MHNILVGNCKLVACSGSVSECMPRKQGIIRQKRGGNTMSRQNVAKGDVKQDKKETQLDVAQCIFCDSNYDPGVD